MAATYARLSDDLVTEALRELRRSALRCRRARVLLDATGTTAHPVASVSAAARPR